MTGPEGEVPAAERTDAFPLPAAHGPGGQGSGGQGGSGVPARPNPLPPPRPTYGDARPSAGRPAPARPTPPRAAQSGGPQTSPPGARPVVRSRKARLAVRRVDPWSVFVLALVISLFLGVMTIVAGYVLYSVLDGAGIPASVNKFVATVQGGDPVLTSSRFVGAAALLAAVNVVLLSVLATLGAVLYNVCATFTGGVEVTLSEQE